MTEATPTIGAKELKAIQAEGWQLWSNGPQRATTARARLETERKQEELLKV